MASEKHFLDKLSVYADLYSLSDDQCVELIRKKIAENMPLTDEDYRIIAVERCSAAKFWKACFCQNEQAKEALADIPPTL